MTVILDGVGRGSNGGELVIGSTSNSASSTGVQIINVTVENSSVIHDISTTNSALEKITLTNGDVKGDFVLTNMNYNAGFDGMYDNVDNVTNFVTGLDNITATDFDGDIVLGRDNDIVDLGTLSANVAGDVMYNANLNDGTYVSVTGSGNDAIDMQLDAATVSISTGNGTNTVTLDEDGAASTATITGGTGVDTIHGDAVAVTVNAGSGNDVIYAENTGTKAQFVVDAGIAADDFDGDITAGSYELLYGRSISVTLATDNEAGDNTEEGYESAVIDIVADSGTYLTTKANLNAAIVKAINEDAVLSKIAKATIVGDNVEVEYLVDGAQNAAAVEVTYIDNDDFADLSTAAKTDMLTEWQDRWNDSTITLADLEAAYDASFATGDTDVSAHKTTTETAQPAIYTINLAGATTADGGVATISFDTGAGAEVVYTDNNDAVADTAEDIAAALVAGGTVTLDGVVYDVTYGDTSTTVITLTAQTNVDETDNLVVTATTTAPDTATYAPIQNGQDGIGAVTMAGTDSVDADNDNVINGQAGDDIIVLSSNAASTDTVVYTDYNQGHDTIVHFETNVDKIDFSSYLTGTISASGSAESQVDNVGLAVTTEEFSADSANLLEFSILGTAVGVTFNSMTATNVEAALEAAGNGTSIALTANLYQDTATSVLIVYADPTDAANNDGIYKAYEVSYDNVAVDAADAKDFTVKLIGSFDLGDADIAAADLAADLILNGAIA